MWRAKFPPSNKILFGGGFSHKFVCLRDDFGKIRRHNQATQIDSRTCSQVQEWEILCTKIVESRHGVQLKDR